MARVTPQGIAPTSLEEYLTALGSAMRSALGPDLNLDPDTPQGQLIGVFALALVEADEALVAVASGVSLSLSIGLQLDDLGSLLGIERLRGTKSTVSVTLTGVAGTIVPEGSRASTGAGDVFELTGDATIGSSGSVDAEMRSVEEGPVRAAADTLTEIFDLVVGWDSVTNDEAASLGRNIETDAEYRARYAKLVARNSVASAEAILAAVLDVEGVTDALIRENSAAVEATVQGKAIGAHSVCVVARGGSDSEVAAAIARSKPVGAGTSGDTTIEVAHHGGWAVPVRFSRTAPVPIKMKLALSLDDGFPSDGTERIIRAAIEHVEKLAVGERLDSQRLLAALLTIPGHNVKLGVGRKSGTVITGAGTVADLVTFHGRATVVIGTGSVASLSTLQGITNGSVIFLGQTVTGLDFSGDNDLDDVASTLQAALRATNAAGLTSVEVDYVAAASSFVVTVPLDGNGAATSVSAAFTGSESDELGLDTVNIINGVDSIKSGSVTLHGATASGLDFSAVTGYDDVASVLQTTLRATSETELDEVEVSYVDGAFVIIVPLTEDGDPVTVTGAATGDTADDLGLDSVSTVQGSVTDRDDIELTERLTLGTADLTVSATQS